MKRFHYAIITLCAFVFACWQASIAYRHEQNRKLDEAYARGVRWGEREKQHLVVYDGKTNKFDSIVEAMRFAPTGSTLYAAAGIWDLGTNRLTMPDGGTFIGSALGSMFNVDAEWDVVEATNRATTVFGEPDTRSRVR